MITTLDSEMVHSPHKAGREMRIHQAMRLMEDCDFRHLPVVDKGRLVGMLSERDLRAALALPLADSLAVEDIMKFPVYAVSQQTALRKVVRAMADRKIGSTVVLDANGKMVGIFTTTDALKLLAVLLEEKDSEQLLLTETLYDGWIPAVQIM
jgi:CBS domain-containing protein